MKTSKLIKLLTIINVLRKLKGIAKVEMKYVDSEWTIPIEITEKKIEQIVYDVSIESIRLLIKF